MIRISKNPSATNLVWISFYTITFLAIYFFSKYLLSIYIFGDQKHYTELYYSLNGASITEVPILQLFHTGSAEPFYGYLVWAASNFGIEKTPLMAASNGILGVAIAATIRKLNGSIALAAVLFTNYYFIVLLTAAERLKFSYIMFCLAILAGGRAGRIIFLLTPITHFQSAITISSVAFARLASELTDRTRRAWDRLKGLTGLSVGFVFLLLLFLRFQERILRKIESYREYGESIFDSYQILILLVTALFVARNRIEAILFFAPLVVSATLLGGSRVNMIGFVMLFYIGLKDKRYFHPVLIALYLYFTFKSFGFVNNIIDQGVGFR